MIVKFFCNQTELEKVLNLVDPFTSLQFSDDLSSDKMARLIQDVSEFL